MTDRKEPGQGVFDIEGVREALGRVLSNPQFVAAPRLASFLKFIVETTLNGDTRSIKAYTIATMALGRPESFDPAADAIVRVEANRLRTALTRYYAFDGEADAMIIELPRGAYVPRFRRRSVNDELVSRWSFGVSLQDFAQGAVSADPATNDFPADEGMLEALVDEYRHWVSDIAKNLAQIRDELTNARAAVAVSNTLVRIGNNGSQSDAGRDRIKSNRAQTCDAEPEDASVGDRDQK
ncbi:MAG: hypothetical protein KGO02_19700 [Alphaproteobacteria bacterium]|nr:hypothetical protein [Alphaproteobacteria bacterium]